MPGHISDTVGDGVSGRLTGLIFGDAAAFERAARAKVNAPDLVIAGCGFANARKADTQECVALN